MVASVEATQALVQDALRLAEEMESLCGQLQRTGGLIAIRRFMDLHSWGNSYFDMLDAAKGLSCYAGLLSVIAARSQQTPAGPVKPTRPKLPSARIDSNLQPGRRKRGQQIN